MSVTLPPLTSIACGRVWTCEICGRGACYCCIRLLRLDHDRPFDSSRVVFCLRRLRPACQKGLASFSNKEEISLVLFLSILSKKALFLYDTRDGYGSNDSLKGRHQCWYRKIQNLQNNFCSRMTYTLTGGRNRPGKTSTRS